MSRVSVVQLDVWEAEVAVLPWRGRSPRELTKSRKALFLSQEAQKSERFFVDPDQLEMFGRPKKGPRRYAGAPLLLPLKGG